VILRIRQSVYPVEPRTSLEVQINNIWAVTHSGEHWEFPELVRIEHGDPPKRMRRELIARQIRLRHIVNDANRNFTLEYLLAVAHNFSF
jgi:hypothetical protein